MSPTCDLSITAADHEALAADLHVEIGRLENRQVGHLSLGAVGEDSPGADLQRLRRLEQELFSGLDDKALQLMTPETPGMSPRAIAVSRERRMCGRRA